MAEAIKTQKTRIATHSSHGVMGSSQWVIWLFLAPALLAMGLTVFYPLMKGIWFSFTDIDQYNMGNAFQAPSYEFVGLSNYREILFDPDSDLLRVLGQTVTWTVINVACHFGLGLLFALLINRAFKGRSFFRLLLMVPWAVPAYVAAFSWRWMFNGDYGLFNQILLAVGVEPINWLSKPLWAMTAAISTNVWLGYPFMMVSLLAGLKTIPDGLYEAAMMDGASRWQQFWHITLPMLKPVSLSVILLGFVWTFNMFPVIYLVTKGGPYGSTEILATYAYREAFESWNLAEASTYGVLILSILIVLSTIYSRLTKEAR